MGPLDPAIGDAPIEPRPLIPPPHPAQPHRPDDDGPIDVAEVSLELVQDNKELSLYIASADRVMEAMGYTEHGFRHANLVARIAYQVLHRLGYTDREAMLAQVAG